MCSPIEPDEFSDIVKIDPSAKESCADDFGIVRRRIQRCDIESMLQDALFKRFADVNPPKGQLQFLTDNGPEFIEKQLYNNLSDWNIESCYILLNQMEWYKHLMGLSNETMFMRIA